MTESSSDEPLHEAFGLDMPAEEFRRVGYELVDLLADFYATIGDRPVTKAEPVDRIRSAFAPQALPEEGETAAALLRRFVPLLLEHSLHNGHPRFFGYITSSAAPIGALADFLASAINANCGLRDLSPAANEVERQTIAWLAELVGFPRPCGGIMVSGGNMANMLAFFAARHAQLPWPVRDQGLVGHPQPVVYASRGTHTWLEKAVDIAGMGTNAISWVATDRDHRLEIGGLEQTIATDRKNGRRPFLVIGTAGNVSTGAIDPLPRIAEIAEREGLWFHVDGAYGAPAAMLPESPDMLKALTCADSVALDPHKWLYNPIEAACTLVRDPAALSNAFTFRPSYYRFDAKPGESAINYYEHGLQNTRGFRALKTWLCIQQAGRAGYTRRIRRDIALARSLYERAMADPELEAGSHHLSITTFRYRPVRPNIADDDRYLDRLNVRIIELLAANGAAFVSNAVLDGSQFLRACIVNFRTDAADIDTLVRNVVRLGREADAAMRNERPADDSRQR